MEYIQKVLFRESLKRPFVISKKNLHLRIHLSEHYQQPLLRCQRCVNSNSVPHEPEEQTTIAKMAVKTYQRLTPLKHILYRPDSYIGPAFLSDEQSIYVYDAMMKRILRKEARIVPGLLKIFDEILVNAADNKRRDPQMTIIAVSIDREKNTISIWNNGRGIPVEIHPTEGVYVPTMIFGTLFTSSNYDDSELKIVGGRNGFGAKLCNIFSTEFCVETCTKQSGLRFFQCWRKNMNDVDDPIISNVDTNASDYTCVTFKPDLSKFKLSTLDEDTIEVMIRRTVDIAGTLDGVHVFLNGTKIEVSGFEDYVKLFSTNTSENFENFTVPSYCNVNNRWQIAVARSNDGYNHTSFVNNINTLKGGRHVDYIMNQLVSRLKQEIRQRCDCEKLISTHQVKNRLHIFVNSLIENPAFESQSKEYLTTSVKDFGSTCIIPESFYENFFKDSDIIHYLLCDISEQHTASLNRSIKRPLWDLSKLEDAVDAGTKNGYNCTLIVTEGDSAKALAVAGLAVIGRKQYGVFPVRGKLTNVRGMDAKMAVKNSEISALIRILGLKFGENYGNAEDLKSLRYGRLLIMTDQDPDGSHIKGLIINLLHMYWPSLLKANYINYFITPLLKAKRGSEVKSFYSTADYERWQAENPDSAKYSIKYYKGLGTSSAKEAREYFTDIERHTVNFIYDGKAADESIDLAFAKNKADDRKIWIAESSKLLLSSTNCNQKTFSEFVNKELLEYSQLDLRRSLPNIVDGYKPSQRKVLFTMFGRYERDEVRVSQLAGAVSQYCGYHHGEESLVNTIIRLAQDFVGSNNLNLLLPLGQFGTRLAGGEDAASARYIYTSLSPLARIIFPRADDKVLKYLMEENTFIEPEWYCPIIPMILINGAEGIGTGWATKILPRCPRQIISNAQRLIDGRPLQDMLPHFRKFQGTINEITPRQYSISGKISYHRLRSGLRAIITELPTGIWNNKYKEKVLDSIMKSGLISSYEELHSESNVHFILHVIDKPLISDKKQIKTLNRLLKLRSVASENSMILFDEKNVLRKYNSTVDIFQEFFEVRRQKYVERREYELKAMDKKLKFIGNQVRFVNAVINGEIIIEKKNRVEIVTQIIEKGFDSNPMKMKNTVDENRNSPDFAYLLDMPLCRLSNEEILILQEKRSELWERFKALKSTTWKSLWSMDLNLLSMALDKEERRM
ncbi:DNA topoisomerase 2 [Loa loa]|uniref:DNA topoisomerase 2 n=1 Tax=Loa loa TaxID=7209 RepID=A0A1S0UJ68_LOALO|nr:DNA topoisomerase 2 [Loa loa]EJD75625.1 DNA topoisomerase 2 [Loa loa]